MFAVEIYTKRRKHLRDSIGKGLLLFPGNNKSPSNYPVNSYPFRQDSNFLHYWGLDEPNLIAVIDCDEDREIIFGNDLSEEDIIWSGPLPCLKEKAEQVGITEYGPLNDAEAIIREAQKKGRDIHFLPPYQADTILQLGEMLEFSWKAIQERVSKEMIRTVINQRSYKSDEEVHLIEQALAISYEMHISAMKNTKAGMFEYEIVAIMEQIIHAHEAKRTFSPLFSVRGEILHNPSNKNKMESGQLVVHDSGVETLSHYSSDITRTFPVNGTFSRFQKEIYNIVLKTQEAAIRAVQSDVLNKDIHLLAARTITEGLCSMGIMKGDPEKAVERGAHALFFPHGIGHMLGLDCHDMDSLGENNVGYDSETRRSNQFGLMALRLGKRLQPGYIVTIEPGIYFIPALIDRWRKEKICSDFINYTKLESYRNFGGIRIEDDVLVTKGGHRVLGKPIPKSVEEIEAIMRN